MNKASSPDGISPKVPKYTSGTRAPVLTKYFTKCLAQNIFPNGWKMANAIPIQKKGDLEYVNNHRLISLLSCIGIRKYMKVVLQNILRTF